MSWHLDELGLIIPKPLSITHPHSDANQPLVWLRQLVRHKKNIGTESVHSFGLMGSGKSNFIMGLMADKISRLGEFMIQSGDVMCEWRHIATYLNGVEWKEPTDTDKKPPKTTWVDYWNTLGTGTTVIIPKGVDIFYHGFNKSDYPDWFIEVDYDKFNILDYLNLQKPLIVVYDQHLSIAERAKLWAIILRQTVRRTVHVETPVNFIWHEAGIIFPESARDKHWRAVRDFGEIFVETRKAGVRCWFISQLETELEYTIRRKCTWKIIRQNMLRGDYSKPLLRQSPFLHVNEYHLVRGGLYDLGCEAKKFPEYKKVWKMIPQDAKIGLNDEEETKIDIKSAIINVILTEKARGITDWKTIADKVAIQTGEQLSADACRKRLERYLESV